jgi:cytochrome c oxidase cbb3-type subunit 3
MHWRVSLLLSLVPICLAAQGRGAGGFIPGQQRPTADPTVVERGKTLYGVQCTGCHGADLRGGDMGGPNLLRSQAILGDVDGEKVIPILQGSRQDSGMPAFPFGAEDMKAVAAYLRSVALTIGRQGMPPTAVAPANILVGDAKAGQQYFDSKCAGCHSAAGDLTGIATRVADARALQNTWVSGGGGGGRRRGQEAESNAPVVTATIALPGGPISGRLVRLDDFEVSVALEDGTVRSVRRTGAVPKVEVHDPLQPHRDLLAVYTDEDIHNLTAYLATLK